MKVAILNCSEIARRRMIPAFQSVEGIEISVVCSRDINKAKEYSEEFGILSYTDDPKEIIRQKPDIVYISSPPSAHFDSAIPFIENRINVLCEKSLTVDAYMTNFLINLSERNGVFIQENYAFPHHSQWKWIEENLHRIGQVLYIRSAFEFPPRDTKTDFRYNPKLGGGALLDAGGYPIKLASLLMSTPQSITGVTNISENLHVDLSGRSFIIDETGVSAFLSWSFESTYRCDVEIVGSLGTIKANKIFTPKADEAVEVLLTMTSGEREYHFFRCDHFAELIKDFKRIIENKDASHHKSILKQSNWQTYVSSTSIRTFTN
jgi:predicted dehydrogenase